MSDKTITTWEDKAMHWTARVIRAVAGTAAAIGILTSWAQSGPSAAFDLPAQSLEASLRQVAASQKLQIVYVQSDLAGIQAKPLKGHLSRREAVDHLIKDTALTA